MPILGPTTDHHEIRHWAVTRGSVPTEFLPHMVDHEPTRLRLMPSEAAKLLDDIRILTWDEFFLQFDQLGLAFVYNDDSTGYNEFLQIEAKSPYRNPKYRPIPVQN